MNERAVQFGGPQPLTGILSDGAVSLRTAERPAVLLLNAGLLHRIGPNRLYVKIARALAESGFTSLRFDHSGLGDSDLRRDGLPYEQSTLAEARMAMDFVTSLQGTTRFVLIGLCSGADNGFRIARFDHRVVGIAPIEGFPRFSFSYYLEQMLHLSAWRRWAKKGGHTLSFLKKCIATVYEMRQARSGAADNWHQPSPARIREDMLALFRRGTKMLFIFAGKSPSNHFGIQLVTKLIKENQLFPQVRLECFAAADHSFTSLRNQSGLTALIDDWMKNSTWADQFVGSDVVSNVDAGRSGSPGAPQRQDT
jgi:hypothetical protein